MSPTTRKGDPKTCQGDLAVLSASIMELSDLLSEVQLNELDFNAIVCYNTYA
jgi:hypothetical protein